MDDVFVDTLEISKRAKKSLISLNVSSEEDIVNLEEKEILKVAGRRAFHEIMDLKDNCSVKVALKDDQYLSSKVAIAVRQIYYLNSVMDEISQRGYRLILDGNNVHLVRKVCGDS